RSHVVAECPCGEGGRMSIEVGSQVRVTKSNAYKAVLAGTVWTVVKSFEEVLMVRFEEPYGGHEGDCPLFARELEAVLTMDIETILMWIIAIVGAVAAV